MSASKSYLKLIIPGEVVEREEAFQMEDGTILKIDTKKKIVVPSKKNQQVISINQKTDAVTGVQTLTPVLLDSAQHQRWHKAHLKIFRAWKSRIGDKGIRLPIVRCKIKIKFYFPDSKRRDLGNKAETIYDMLSPKTGVGIIFDDEFKVLGPIEIMGWVKRDEPRTEIYLTILEPGHPEYEWDLTDPSWAKTQKTRKTQLQKVRRLKKRQSKEAGSGI
jgi:hypothetical protein